MDKYPFTKCLEPQQIRNPHTGDVLIVGCGKCEACLSQKSSMRSLKCKLESLSHDYAYFVTLTYANEYVPLMKPFLPSSEKNKEFKKYYFIDNCQRNDGCGDEILSEALLSISQLDALLKKCNLGDSLPYLCKRDAQLFLKRLRKYISKYSDEKLRYFLTGELGPVHFRPHFHFILWFSDPEIQKVISQAVSACWTYGRVDTDLSQGKCANYVAGYLNGSGYLPKVFKNGKCAPFSTHSRFLGEKFLQSSKEEVYSQTAEDFVRRSICVDGLNADFNVWRSLKTGFFPRCPMYQSLSHAERLQSYRTHAEATDLCGETKPFKQAKMILDAVKSNAFLRGFPLCQYFMKKYNFDEHTLRGLTNYERNLRRVYMELRVSEHFLNFVCNSNHPLELDTKLTMIERFYDACELMNLANMYLNQDEFFKYDALDMDDLVLFYYNRPFAKERLSSHPTFRKYKEKTLNNYRDSVKHKILNDQNLIFNY